MVHRIPPLPSGSSLMLLTWTWLLGSLFVGLCLCHTSDWWWWNPVTSGCWWSRWTTTSSRFWFPWWCFKGLFLSFEVQTPSLLSHCSPPRCRTELPPQELWTLITQLNHEPPLVTLNLFSWRVKLMGPVNIKINQKDKTDRSGPVHLRTHSNSRRSRDQLSPAESFSFWLP